MLDLRKAATIILEKVPLHQYIIDAGIAELKQAGDAWKALCPFHNERDPSFTIRHHKGTEKYFCYGCHKKGNLIDFVKATQLIDYPEAVEYIATKYDVDISDAIRTPTAEEAELERKYEIMSRVTDWMFERLIGERDKAYRYMIDERGISEEVLEKFKIGYSSNVSDLLGFIAGEKLGSTVDLEFDKNSSVD